MATLDGVLDALTTTVVDTAMPRFDLEAQLELSGELRSLGLNAPFVDESSFDGIIEDLGVITAVVHQTVIGVDEKGTEAAAATGVVISDTSVPEPGAAIVVDRPFVLAIRDQPTDALPRIACVIARRHNRRRHHARRFIKTDGERISGTGSPASQNAACIWLI